MRLGIEDVIGDKRQSVLEIAAQHGALNVRVFGSVARGEATLTSDIDLLIDLAPVRSEWFPMGLIQEWEALLGYKVQAVTVNGLHPLIREQVLKEAIPL